MATKQKCCSNKGAMFSYCFSALYRTLTNALVLSIVSLLLVNILFLKAVSAQASSEEDDDLIMLVPSIVNAINSPPTVDPLPPQPVANLCNGYTENDLSNRPMPSLTRPQPGASYQDPIFGSNITRITDAGSISSGVMRNLYSTIQAWNADESKMILWHRGEGHYLYDGNSYQLIGQLNIAPADIEQVYWSQTDPDTFLYVNVAVGVTVTTPTGPRRLNGKELIRYSVSNDHYTIIKEFNDQCPSDPVTAGNDAQMISDDSDVIGLRCGDQGFSYQVSNDQITALAGDADFAAPQPFPSGDRFYHRGRVLNEDLQVERSLSLGAVNEHANLGKLDTGEDAYFSVGFNRNSSGSCDGAIGSLVVHDATSNECSVLVGPATGYPFTLSGTHVSALASKNPGWVAVSSIGFGVEGDSLLEQELYLANTHQNNRTVCRIAHHRATGRRGSIGYFAEPHPIISPSGTRILFNSDWNDSGQVDAYVLELPSF